MGNWLILALLVLALPLFAAEDTSKRFSQTVYLQPYSKLRQAAEAGDPSAQFDLAYLYYKADSDPAIQGVIQSNSLAARWYRKAAEQGHVKAQYNMAVLHLQGHGVSRDPVSAYAWLLHSAGQGHQASIELKGELDGMLNEKQIDAAQQQSAELNVTSGSS
jgi:TPR repeat protein